MLVLIDIEPKEWEAIQHRAISANMLERILNNTDMDKVKGYSMPRKTNGISPAKLSRAKAMLKQERQLTDIAEALNVSVSTLQNALNPKPDISKQRR